ncbi:MAG: hypothetical protein K0S33_3714 [Bacteroidetes bacterium]|jgi:hypothetical protein|nr:hypothetical protein [Bacteroidota bacterium]
MKKVPIFKTDGLVHHSDYMKVCGEEYSSSTTNLRYVTCKKCLELIGNKIMQDILSTKPNENQ